MFQSKLVFVCVTLSLFLCWTQPVCISHLYMSNGAGTLGACTVKEKIVSPTTKKFLRFIVIFNVCTCGGESATYSGMNGRWKKTTCQPHNRLVLCVRAFASDYSLEISKHENDSGCDWKKNLEKFTAKKGHTEKNEAHFRAYSLQVQCICDTSRWGLQYGLRSLCVMKTKALDVLYDNEKIL